MTNTRPFRWAPLAGATLLFASCASSGATALSDTVGKRVELGTVTDTQGRVHDLDGTLASGKEVALVFFQPWCGSCKAEAPTIVRARTALADSIEILGVVSGPTGSVDEDAVEGAILGWGLNYPVVRDREMDLTNQFDVAAVPVVVIVSPDGRVAYAAPAAPAEWHGLE